VPRRVLGIKALAAAAQRRSTLRQVDADSVNRAFERIRDFEAVQSQAVCGLTADERGDALGNAVHNLREAVAITDEATAAFHAQIGRLFEDATGLKLPVETGEWAFLGFILGLIAIEMEQDARGD
jgi:delta 1-pyrroline-5-carboxylate dehydrogenase